MVTVIVPELVRVLELIDGLQIESFKIGQTYRRLTFGASGGGGGGIGTGLKMV